MNILVSSCLLGLDCRYCGDNCYSEKIAGLSAGYTHIPVCPEQMGGLPTPRAPLERSNGKVIDKDGRDFTQAMQKGASEVLKIAVLSGCSHAIIKSGSPSCGCGTIYDGSFSGRLIEGNGVMAQELIAAGIEVTDEHHFTDIFKSFPD